jgi:type VI secretion system protein ImpG
MHDDPLYKAFLSELEALEKFRISYSGMNPHVPLQREDPDVRRLIEAMAMFNARTRRSAERGLGLSMLRLFRQHFPFLLSPVPSVAMLQAHTSPRFVEAAVLPAGARITVQRQQTARPGAADRPPPALSYRTLRPLRVLPITLDRLDTGLGPDGGVRVVLTFEAAHQRIDGIGRVDLYVNHLDDFASSLTVHHALRKHFVRGSVVFDAPVGETSDGHAVEVRFDGQSSDAVDAELLGHPIERARSLLHFPQQLLFISIDITRQPRAWRRFSVVLELGPRWPRDLKLNAESFRLHAVPMVNLVRDMAVPITVDGTRDRYPVLHDDAASGYRFHSLAGTYRLDEKDGLVPLLPGVVGASRSSYELETEGSDEGRTAYLVVDEPRAFLEPFRVAVEAQWYQPQNVAEVDASYTVLARDRYFDGLSWKCLGGVSRSHESRFGNDVQALLSLLAMKNKRFLERDELVFVLSALGVEDVPSFATLTRAIKTVEVEQQPFARGSTGFKYVYRIGVGRVDISECPALELMAARVLEVLRAWSVDDVVELVLSVPTLQLEQILR